MAFFLLEKGGLMNYFFKYLLPQLLEYFNNDNEKLLAFIPQVLVEKCDINKELKNDEK